MRARITSRIYLCDVVQPSALRCLSSAFSCSPAHPTGGRSCGPTDDPSSSREVRPRHHHRRHPLWWLLRPYSVLFDPRTRVRKNFIVLCRRHAINDDNTLDFIRVCACIQYFSVLLLRLDPSKITPHEVSKSKRLSFSTIRAETYLS